MTMVISSMIQWKYSHPQFNVRSPRSDLLELLSYHMFGHIAWGYSNKREITMNENIARNHLRIGL